MALLRGHHRELRQRSSAAKLDRVMDHAESDEEWLEDDDREQSCWKLEKRFILCRERALIRTVRIAIRRSVGRED